MTFFCSTNKVFSQIRKPVIIDSDMGTDDWPAILYLLNKKDVKVVGIVIDGNGETHCDATNDNHASIGAKNALRLVKLAGKESENIPVACGFPYSLKGNHAFPAAWRHDADSMSGLDLPFTSVVPSKENGAQLISSLLKKSDTKIDIVALGPLTNIAYALEAEPTLKHHIQSIIIMGGAVNVPGNLDDPGAPKTENTTAEWNIFIDPHSAQIVFKSSVPIQLIPLDGTNDVPVTMDFANKLKTKITTPSAQFVYNHLIKETNFILSGKFYFWDPLTATIMTNPDICEFKEYKLSVNDSEGTESGRTFINQEHGSPVDVCIKANKEKFEQVLLEGLN